MVKPALYRCGSNDCEISALVLFIRGRSSSQRFEQIKWLRSEEHNAKVYKIFVNETIIVKKYIRKFIFFENLRGEVCYFRKFFKQTFSRPLPNVPVFSQFVKKHKKRILRMCVDIACMIICLQSIEYNCIKCTPKIYEKKT